VDNVQAIELGDGNFQHNQRRLDLASKCYCLNSITGLGQCIEPLLLENMCDAARV
jgi:hypothetical protein